MPHCKNWCDEQSYKTYHFALNQNNKAFDQIQKALDDYLERKRDNFQRFCFLSNPELLSILSKAKQVRQMMPHLKKVFENLVEVELDEEEITGLAMISLEGEKVPLKSCSLRAGEIEEWLIAVEDSMKYSLKIQTRAAIMSYENEDRKDWITKFCCQVMLTVDSI